MAVNIHSPDQSAVAEESPVSIPVSRPITLLINANSRRGKLLFDDAVAAVKAAGIEVGEVVAVKDREETVRLLKREIAEGALYVIVGGGDGTLSTCADSLAGTSVALGVLPMGTGNTFARSIGIPLDLKDAAKSIAEGHIETCDVGRVNGQAFLNSVSLGLSCEIAGALDKETKKKLGLLSWPVVGARVLWRHKPLQIRIRSHERSFVVRTHQLLIVNGRYVAGPIASSPDASVQDHTLDVFTLGGAGQFSLVRATWAWLRGRHLHSADTKYFETQKLRIESLRRPLDANVDGEISEKTPLDIEIHPGALRIMVPLGFQAKSV